MLVRFDSSETAEVLMYADTAKMLLTALGKETTARGTFTQPEMLPAAEALREAARQAAQPPEEEDEEGKDGKKKGIPVVHEACVGCGVCEMICPTEPASIEIIPGEGWRA